MRKTRLNFVILLLAFFAFLGSTQAQTARIQLIHNAADAVASSVDVFVNGAAFYPNFDFRTATPFVDVPAGTDLTIDIAPAGAGIEASVYDITVNFDADETYVIVANGIVSDNGYDPAPAFSVYPFAGAREAGMNTNETSMISPLTHTRMTKIWMFHLTNKKQI